MEVRTHHNGRIVIDDGNTTIFAAVYHVCVFDDVAVVQMGNGEKYAPPAQIKNVGDKHVCVVGDYEIEIRRVKPKITNNKGIISLKRARRFRGKIEK